jgi:hypothetical protein
VQVIIVQTDKEEVIPQSILALLVTFALKEPALFNDALLEHSKTLLDRHHV